MRRVVLATLMVAGLFVPARPAWACTCGVRSVAEHIDAAAMVFTGTVRSVAPAAESQIAATFDVAAVYKGDPERRLTVSTASDAAACGTPFARDTTYVVFAARDDDALSTGICSGTTDDVAVVAGLAPIQIFAPPNGELPGDEPGSRSLPIGTAAGLVTLVLAASIWAWMIRVRPPRPLV